MKKDLNPVKGIRDLGPKEALLKQELIDICTGVFKKHGGYPVELPTIEKNSLLEGKYGEDTKLIFNLQGDKCSLRYDLTVPFARYLTNNKITKMRKYQIGNVFRRDQPSTKRQREFCQADFDICGDPTLSCDVEVLLMVEKILSTIWSRYFTKYNSCINKFVIKVNHRTVITDVLYKLGVTEELVGPVCSALDKVDKLSVEELKSELKEKGVSVRVVENLMDLVENRSNSMTYAKNLLQADNESLKEFEQTLQYIESLGIQGVEFDLCMVRGLTYYTGIIFEGIPLTTTSSGDFLSSIAGGGRYDNLCKEMDESHNPACVGFSIGITRLMSMVVESCGDYWKHFLTRDLLIGSAFGECTMNKLQLMQTVSQKYSVEVYPQISKKINFNRQVEYAAKNNFRGIVFTGETESQRGVVNIYVLKSGIKVECKIDCLLEKLEELINFD